MASILDSVDAYQDLLAEIWKDKYKEDIPEGISLLLGQLKFELSKYPNVGDNIKEELLTITDS